MLEFPLFLVLLRGFPCSAPAFLSFSETAETGALPGWAGAAAGGEGGRVQPPAGAAGEEDGGGPAEHQGVSAADGAWAGLWRGCKGPRLDLEVACGQRETGNSPEAERGWQRWCKDR